MRLIDVAMGENDVDAKTVGEFLKMLLLRLWEEAECFSGKRPFGNSDWQYQVYASLIKAGYEVGRLDEDGYVEAVDYAKADKLVAEAITAAFDKPSGKWEKAKYIEAPVYVCSECGNREPLPRKFCPECGAMTEKEE